MSEENVKKIEAMVAEGKIGEARSLLKSLFKQELTKEQKGALYANLTLTYLSLMNAVNEKYKESLRESLSKIKEVKTNSQ